MASSSSSFIPTPLAHADNQGEGHPREAPFHSSNISLCDFNLIPKIKEPIRGRRFVIPEDIANAVRQQVTRFTHGAANAEADGIQCLPHSWQRVVTGVRG
ncbi:uncharacterized protein TNCV_2823501 [Trichonephila clavipes]|nr:uncharacterized protein TNCV_2823501 [Trichonephila clavipes]